MVGKIFFKILSFFIFCFIVKCTDDNYVFVDIYYGSSKYEIKGNLEEKKIKIDDDFTNKNFENFINKVGQKTYKDDQNFKNFLDKNPKEKINYIIVSNNITNKDDFFDFYHNYYFEKICNLNDNITSKEFKIYKDFSEMIDDNNYKQKTIHLMYGGYYDLKYDKYKKNIKKIQLGVPVETIELKDEVKIEDEDITILSILKDWNGYNIFTKKINEKSEPEFRLWTDHNGKKIKARWLATDNDGEHITLETPSGKKINAVLRKFSAEDRAYIQSKLDANR